MQPAEDGQTSGKSPLWAVDTMKELEFLEKISERIGNVSLVGGGTLAERLGQLLIRDGDGKE